MNAKLTVNTMMILTGLLILSLASCANPTNPGLSVVETSEPETGISEDPATGLIAGLPLEGDTILNNPDVVVSDGVEWVGGLSGNAMRGDEDGDFLRITDGALPELTSTGSVEVWVYPETNTAWAGILHKGQEINFSDEAWSLQYEGGKKVRFYYYGETGNMTITAGSVLTENEWHHLAVTWDWDGDTTELKLYIDGVLNQSVSATGKGPVKDSNGDLIVGSQLPEQYNASYGHLTFMGLIDEISLFNRMRTAEEIETAYQVYFPAP